MAYKTLMEVLTFGDYMTQPGGIALRDRLDGRQGPRYIVQRFNTDRETGTERHYWGTEYGETLSDALTVFAKRVKSAEYYDTGGALNTTGGFLADNPAFPDYAKGGERDRASEEVSA